MSDNDVDPGSDKAVSSAAAASDSSAASDREAASDTSGASPAVADSGLPGAADRAVGSDETIAPAVELGKGQGGGVEPGKSGRADETVRMSKSGDAVPAVEVEKTVAKPGSVRDAGVATTTARADGSARAAGRGKLVAAGSIGAIALGAAVGAACYFFVQNDEHEGLLAAHEEARQAACDYAPRLADYDAKDLDAYFAAVLDGATGEWHEQFDDTSRELRVVLSEGQVVSKVHHVECAIKTGDETSAEAVIMIGQTITSVGTQGQPAPGQLAMVLRMEKTDGRWLVNQVDSPLPVAQQ